MGLIRTFIYAPALLLLLLGGCQSTTQGIGGGDRSSSAGLAASGDAGGIEVLRLSYEDALRVAEKAGRKAYENVRRAPGQDVVYIESYNFIAGDVRAQIEPILIRNSEAADTGIIYQVKAQGIGANASMLPGYVSSSFFEKLREVIAEENIPRVRFQKYEQLKLKGVTDSIAASIPLGYEAFASYIDGKPRRDPYEGIWADSENLYTVGLVRDDADRRYSYKAFIISTRLPDWQPGDVKIKFSNLGSPIALGAYHRANKREINLSFQASPDYIVSLPSTQQERIIFAKIYPSRDQAVKGASSGSAWHVGQGYFVTNAHVVEGGRKLTINLGNAAYPSRVVAIDSKLDLAIVKAEIGSVAVPAIPMTSDVRQGRAIFTVGFPLGRTLGDSVKITNGIISALEGIGGDPTVIGITAAVQPGNSGGPVLDEEGRAVGVVVAKLRNAENVNYAVKIDYLIPLLKQAGIAVLNAPNGKKLDVCAAYCASVALLEVE